MTAFRHLLRITLPLSFAGSCLADDPLWLRVETSQAEPTDAEQQRTRTLLGTDIGIPLDTRAEPTWRWQLQHDYRVLTLADGADSVAANNGQLHQLSFAMQWQHSVWQAMIQPLIATSSNALRDAGQLQHDDWRLQAALTTSIHRDDTNQLRLGLQLDDRLGRYAGYPVVSWQHQLTDSLQYQLGWPDNAINWRHDPHWYSRFLLAPTGGQWHVYNKDFQQDSTLRFEQWQFAWQLHWQVSAPLQLTAGFVRNMQQTLRYQLQDGSERQQAPTDSTAWQIAVQLQF